jgi:apolipoprotein N-acyltransferase
MSVRLKFKLMALFTFINAVIGITLGGLLYTIWPEHYFDWYPSIPIFYWVTGIVLTYLLDRVKKKKGDVTITTFMVVRFCKFTMALAFLWLYASLIGQQMKTFGFTLMLFYFIYLGLETYTVYLFEKKRMKREKKEKNELYQK